MLMTLCYAFYFTFSGLGLKIPPNSWPLAWLVLAALIFINPFPFFYPYSRWWILRKTGGLFISGTHRVEVRW
jgi:xenotropic and polytropic retrovirus receptor 1